mmetsp:Transcript_33774/g.34412  ORF Transcript_33774/g.34412 Transcript_33774/m.34412 type:complete len:385 (-) Transcript_33774:165-1319(-)
MDRTADSLLPCGLPMSMDDVLMENDDPVLMKGVSCLDPVSPLRVPSSVFTSLPNYGKIDNDSCDLNSYYPNICDNRLVTEQPCTEKTTPFKNNSTPLWSKTLGYSLARTHVEIACSLETAIAAIQSFLISKPSCIMNFHETESRWDCQILKSFETISFAINLFYNIDNNNNTILIEFRRFHGNGYIYRELYHEFRLFLQSSPSIKEISLYQPIKPEIMQRKLRRNQPLQPPSIPDKSQLITDIQKVCDWLQIHHTNNISTQETESLHPLDEITVQNNIEGYDSLSTGITIGSLLLTNVYTLTSNIDHIMAPTSYTHQMATSDFVHNSAPDSNNIISDRLKMHKKMLLAAMSVAANRLSCIDVPMFFRPHPDLLSTLQTSTCEVK